MGKNPTKPLGAKGGKDMPPPATPKKPKVLPLPAPVVFEKPPYVKRSSMSPEQGDEDGNVAFYDRTAYTEDMPEELPTSRTTKNWGNGSYDQWGHPVSTGNEYGGSKVNAGPHTESPPRKRPSRPGRW